VIAIIADFLRSQVMRKGSMLRSWWNIRYKLVTAFNLLKHSVSHFRC